MKKGFRRALCFLLVAMLLSIMAMPAYAATTGKNGLFSYTMRGNGTLTITKFDWSGYQKNTDIVIPQMIDGYTVTAIGDLAFSQGDVDVEKVKLPDRKYEAKDAVLIIPNTVTTVGEKAFFNSGIGRVNIPASVNSIGAAAFCTGCLKNVTVQPGNEKYAAIEGALYDKKAKELLAEAGYPDGFTFTIKVPSNYQPHIDTATVLAEQLKAIGVTANIELIEWESWLSDVYKERQFEATVVGVDASTLTAGALLGRFVSTAHNNFVNYNNADYDAAYENAQSATSDEEATKYYKECEKILTDTAANVYIQDMAELVALNKKYAGYEFYPLYIQDIAKLYIVE